MKTTFPKPLLIPLLLLLSSQALYAFYDPQTQRWINRDPIGEHGGANLYCMIRNRPTDRVDLFGLNVICVDPNCAGVDLSGFSYVAEREPGDPEPPKRLRELPKPGQCVEADAVYEPGKATKVSDLGSGNISCPNGKPQFNYIPGAPWGIRGDGCVWKFGDPPPPPNRRWPSPNLPPYQTKPPTKPAPPLDPAPNPKMPDPMPI